MLTALLALLIAAPGVETITPGTTLIHGAVNGVIVRRNGKALAVYGDPREKTGAVERVLFTHGRRDVVWAGRELVRHGAEPVVPAGDKAMFTGVKTFWDKYYASGRFQDYSNQS